MKFVTSLLFLFFCCSIASSISNIEKITGTTTRLSEGSTATLGLFPYVVEVKLLNSARCGGVIINENWILTAAICAMQYEIESVRVGAVNHVNPEAGSYVVPIDKQVVYSDWILNQKYMNNVALLHLKQPLIFSEVVQPAQLADQSKPIDMSLPVTVAGWGGNLTEGPAVTLQYNNDFMLIHESSCTIDGYEITPNSICTNSNLPYPQTCFWDIGGPLLQLDSSNQMVLHGIVSIFDCASNRVYNAFHESIINHRDWIRLVSGA